MPISLFINHLILKKWGEEEFEFPKKIFFFHPSEIFKVICTNKD